MNRQERAALEVTRQIDREMAENARSCDWHTHSIFARCVNGVTLRGYLFPITQK